MKKRIWIIGALALAAAAALAVLALTGPGGSGVENKNGKWAGKSTEEIVSSLTLSQKAAQMVLPACYNVTERMMRENGYGGFISLEWVKRWCQELEAPGIVFVHYINYMRKALA